MGTRPEGRPGFGSGVATQKSRISMAAGFGIVAVVIAAYDGVLGPGTGTFLIVTLTVLVGTSFLENSRAALGRGSGFVRWVLLVVG